VIAIRSGALRGASSSLAGSTFIYAVISGVRSGIAFVMLPIYARTVTPAEYGQLAIAWVIASLLTGVLTFGLETAVTRWYFRLESEPEARKAFVASTWKFLIAVPNLIVVTAWLLLAGIAGSSLSIPLSFLLLAGLQASLWISATIVPFALLRAQRRIRVYALLNWIFIAVSVVVTTTLLYATNVGAIGWLVGNLAATVALAALSAYVMRSYLSVPFSPTLVRPAIAYGIPLIPHMLALWALALVDRLILQAYRDSTDVGIYNLAYQIATILLVLLVAANQGTIVEFGRAMHDAVARIELRRVVTLQFSVTIALATTIALLGPVLVALLLPESYLPAAGYVGWLVLGTLAFCLSLLPMNSLTILAGKTRWVWTATTAAAAANIVLNFILIPRIGIAGAAYATAIGYGVLLVAIAVMARAFQPPGIYDRVKLAAVTAAGAVAYVGGVLTAHSLDARSLVIRTLWLVAAALIVTLFLWRQRERAHGRLRIS
jgi:O-antigen/teichoic acid export membrane protein